MPLKAKHILAEALLAFHLHSPFPPATNIIFIQLVNQEEYGMK
jgi:hypothetical protein